MAGDPMQSNGPVALLEREPSLDEMLLAAEPPWGCQCSWAYSAHLNCWRRKGKHSGCPVCVPTEVTGTDVGTAAEVEKAGKAGKVAEDAEAAR